jgi:hypothetical protein
MAPKEIKRLREIITDISEDGDVVVETIKDLDVKALYDWRRGVSRLYDKPKDATEKVALSIMVKQFDDSMDNAISSALQSGNDEAVKAWKKAIAMRRKYGQVFESGDLVSELIDQKRGRLKIAPEAASNYIFGASDTKLLNQPQMARELKKVKSLLGPDSGEWNAIREEAFLRMAERGEYGAMRGGEYGFSGVNFKKAVDSVKRKNKEVWALLFDDEERKLITQFANVAAKVTNPVKGGANFSNTSTALSGMVQSLFGSLFMGEKGKALLSRIFPMAYEGLQMGPAHMAAAGRVPLRQIAPGVAGGIAATTESQTGFLEDF